MPALKSNIKHAVCVHFSANDSTYQFLGHFGVAKLAATVHNPYFIDEVVHFLNQICPGCLSPRENIDLKVCNFLTELFSNSLSTTYFVSLPKFIDTVV